VPLLGEGLGRDEVDPARARERGDELLARTGKGSSASTDSEGRFRIGGLAPGWLDLLARPPKGAVLCFSDLVAGTEDLVLVLPGEEDYGKELGVVLLVTVVDGVTQRPVPGASVNAFPSESRDRRVSKDGRTATADGTGRARFAFGVDGFFWVDALADGYGPACTELTDFPVGEHALRLELLPCGALAVRVVGADGHALGGYWISAHTPAGEALTFEHSEGGGSSSRDALMSDAEGRASANRMKSGRFVLEVRASRDPNDAVLASSEVEVVPGRSAEVELLVAR